MIITKFTFDIYGAELYDCVLFRAGGMGQQDVGHSVVPPEQIRALAVQVQRLEDLVSLEHIQPPPGKTIRDQEQRATGWKIKMKNIEIQYSTSLYSLEIQIKKEKTLIYSMF
jgi:hypothetical protein